jgi:predicted nucleic acid-binding protein
MAVSIRRIYVDSSVVYGAPSKEFSHDSKEFWEAFRRGEFVIIASDVLDEELERAPKHIRAGFNVLPKSLIERVESTPESNALAAQYLAENVVGKSSFDDCRHIAFATIANADALVSWNFGHVVERRDDYNGVNEKLGYPSIKIQTPRQFLEENNESM